MLQRGLPLKHIPGDESCLQPALRGQLLCLGDGSVGQIKAGDPGPQPGQREGILPEMALQVENMRCPCPMPDGQFPAVQLMDFDFDGHKDIRVMRMTANLTNPDHNYWLWDPAEKTYRASAVLDSIQQPMFDQGRKMVSSQWYDGGLHRGGSTFRYVDGRLTMVSNMEKFKEGDHERWVIWGLKDGIFQPVIS